MSEEATPAVEGAEAAAPVIPESQAIPPVPEVKTDEPQAKPAEPEADSDERKRGAEKRIKELTKNWRSTERDRDYWRDLALRNSQGQQAKPEPTPQNGKPTLEQFNFDQDAYNEAVIDWKVQQKLSEHTQKSKKDQEQTEAQKQQAEFRQRLQSAAEKYDDFEETITDPSLPMPDHVVQAAMNLGETAGDVLYHLGKNPDKALQIANMNPAAAAVALGRIDAQIANQPKPQISKAPPPPSAVGNRSAVNVDPMKLPAEEWARRRNEELAKRYGRR